MNFKAGPVKKSPLVAVVGGQKPKSTQPNPAVGALGAVVGQPTGPSAGPAKKFAGIRGLIGGKK